MTLLTALAVAALAADPSEDPAPAPADAEPIEAPIPEEPDDESLVVEVHAPHADRDDTKARTTLDQAELERARGQDLGDTVSAVPGVVSAGGTADTAKPVVRGFQERRLLLVRDGVRHESQKWGADHAPEIDPFSAGSISVIKGAAGVRYGPDAIGGVILVDPPPMRDRPGHEETLDLVGVSNGARFYGAGRVDAVLGALPDLSLRLEGNYGRGASLRAPDYVLGNTGSEQWNLGGALRWEVGRATIRATAAHYDLRAGVFYGVQNGTPDDFLAQVEAGEPVGADRWRVDYAIDRPYQSVKHDVAALHVEAPVGDLAHLEVAYSFQSNRREEYEQVRTSVTGPQYDFTLRTHALDASVGHEGLFVGSAALSGEAGVSGTFQENVYRGLQLVPNFRAFGAGVYAFERLSWPGVIVEAGLRYDHLSRTAWLGDEAFERQVRRGTLDASTCAVDGDVARCPGAWDAVSATVGAVVHAVPQAVDLKLDLSSASRFPNADELYLDGSAPTFPVYAVGSPSLRTETTWGVSPTLGLTLPWVEGEASVFLNHVDRFVYFAPELEDGEPRFDVTIRGAFPRWSFRPIDALFYGADGGLSFGPTAPIGLVLAGAVVRAQEVGTGEALVGIPADRASGTVVLRPGPLGPLRDGFLEFETTLVGRQSRVDPKLDFAPPPDGYVIVGLSAGAEVPLGALDVGLGVEVRNLFDVAHRDYTSLLRYYADEPGREIRVRLHFHRHSHPRGTS